ncbi:LysR family transcriptional regulator [Vibrio sp. ER1A]|uniref:LysR family transcriptional regulator n=1 Tax=Vibrio sp. ER1A TaxID=1517681 RepID=UPI0004DCB2C4|nr:LysR family transcriptional regulator [Vibrio sp. ER1A]KFA96735.1 hypothetical protein HW45_18275 [Vibrio sp. ER1A]
MASIEQLESFVAVAKTGSVVAAAEKLGKTHGPVSLAIQNLESRWGELFVVGTGKKQLSEKGEAILPWAEAVIASYYELKNAVAVESPTQITLGVDIALPRVWQQEILASIIDLDISIRVNCLPSDELIAAFNAQHLDWIVTLVDLPWPETPNFFSLGTVDSYLITSSKELLESSNQSPIVFDSGHLLTLPQLSISHAKRTSAPIYKRFDFPCPWQIRVTDHQQIAAILSELPSHTSAVYNNIDLTDTMKIVTEPHLKATWGVSVFWGEHLTGSQVLQCLTDWAMSKSMRGRQQDDS